MKKILPFLFIALLLVSAQCSFSIAVDNDPTTVFSDDFSYNQGWNYQYSGEFRAYRNNEVLWMNLSSSVTEGNLFTPISSSLLSNYYTLQVELQVASTLNRTTARILLNYLDNLNYDFLEVDDEGNWRFDRIVNNSIFYSSGLRASSALYPASFNQTNTVTISQHETRIDLNFNGNLQSLYLDALSSPVETGLGIGATNGGSVYYDNFYLTRLAY